MVSKLQGDKSASQSCMELVMTHGFLDPSAFTDVKEVTPSTTGRFHPYSGAKPTPYER